jgi:WhiB family transcriptional regulator, redox-sensing transcriptional regulator
MTRPNSAAGGTANGGTLTIPGRWAERALCAGADPDAWFPDRSRRQSLTLAKRICGHCPVRAECLDYALSGADTWAGISNGIWGGTTPRDRAQIRRRQRRAVAA